LYKFRGKKMKRRINLKIREYADEYKKCRDGGERMKVCRDLVQYAKVEAPLKVLKAYEIFMRYRR